MRGRAVGGESAGWRGWSEVGFPQRASLVVLLLFIPLVLLIFTLLILIFTLRLQVGFPQRASGGRDMCGHDA